MSYRANRNCCDTAEFQLCGVYFVKILNVDSYLKNCIIKHISHEKRHKDLNGQNPTVSEKQHDGEQHLSNFS